MAGGEYFKVIGQEAFWAQYNPDERTSRRKEMIAERPQCIFRLHDRPPSQKINATTAPHCHKPETRPRRRGSPAQARDPAG